MNRSDEAAFVEFVKASSPSLLRTAWLLTGNQHAAEELVQESLVRLYPKWRKVRDQQPRAYTRRILVNLHTSTWRKYHRELPSHSGDLPESVLTDPTSGSDDRDHALRMLRKLPPRERQVIVLRYYADLSERDVVPARCQPRHREEHRFSRPRDPARNARRQGDTMNPEQITQLMQEAPAPPLHVEVDQVIARGRSRQRRGRSGAVGAVIGALVLATAIVVGWPGAHTASVTPASQGPTATSPFFQHEKGLAADQVTKWAFSGGGGMTTRTKVLTVVENDGALSVHGKGTTRTSPIAFTMPGTLGRASIIDEGKGSILLTPVPADATSIYLDDNTAGSEAPAGATLPDRTHVAAIFTAKRLTPGSVKGWFWATTDGQYMYSTGERASTTTMGTVHIFYFPDQKLLGSATNGGQIFARPGGALLANGTSDGAKGVQWAYTGLVPRDASSIHAVVPTAYHSRWNPVVRSAPLPGTPYSVVGMSLTSPTSKPSGHPRITWVDSHGTQHTMH